MKGLSCLAIFVCVASSSVLKRNRLDGLNGIRLDYGVDTISAAESRQFEPKATADVMESLREKLSAGSDQAIFQLTSVLMLKNSSTVIAGLKSKIDGFQSTLLHRLEDDLSKLSEHFVSQRQSGPLTDEEKYEFSEKVQNQWRETLSAELSFFQQSALPKWINSVRNVWKGIENQIMEKIQKFKKFMQNHIPFTAAVCRLPKSGVKTRVGSLDLYGSGRLGISKRLEHLGSYALLTLAIAASIVLAIFAPYVFGVISIVLLFDLATMYVVDNYIDKDKTVSGDSETNDPDTNDIKNNSNSEGTVNDFSFDNDGN